MPRLQLNGIPLAFIDIEASALEKGSFPIELGWAPAPSGESESLLIRPTDEWIAHGIWSGLSEAIHGISMIDLQTEGRTTPDAIARLEAALSGALVVSDAVEWDSYWLHRLYETVDRPCPIKLQPFDIVIMEFAVANGLDRGFVAQRIEEWSVLASEAAAHRAGADAADNFRHAVAILSNDLEADKLKTAHGLPRANPI